MDSKIRNMMKRLIYSIIALLAFAACEKDGEKLIVTDPGAPSDFGASATDIVLSKDGADALVLTLFWNEGALPTVSDPTVALPDDLTESSIMFSASEDFASYTEMFLGNGQTSLQFTGSGLSQLLMKLGLTEVEQYNVYVRLAVRMGKEYTYSDVLVLKITPYAVETGWMRIVDKNDASNVLATLYSKDAANTLFGGFAVPSGGWYNCFFVAADGTVWGCNADWTAFSLVPDSSNNCWFAEPSGCQYVFADTAGNLWWHINVPVVSVNIGGTSVELKYSKSAGGYSGTVTAAADNASFTVTGTGARFDVTTGTDAGIPGIEYPFCLVPSGEDMFEFVGGAEPGEGFVIGTAGTYTLTFNVFDCKWSLKEGAEEPPVVNYPKNVSLYYFAKEGSDKLGLACEMAETETEGVFEGFIYTDPDWSAEYSNFRFVADDVVYGTSDQFTLDESGWNMWSNNTGMNYVAVDFSAMKWSETKVSQVAATGDFNDWSLDSDRFTFNMETGKWEAVCDIANVGWGFKFVLGDAENGWRWMYADTDLDGTLSIAGNNDNIVPSEGGKFKIELSLSSFAAPTYTMTPVE